MQLILKELEDMFVGSIPTTLLFVVLVVAYQVLVQGPLSDVLKRRRALTEGAMEDAQKAIAEAEARATDYTNKLRQARADVYKIREQRVKQWTAERDATLDEARKAAHEKAGKAKAAIETEAEAARVTIQNSASELAGQVVRAVLPVGAGGTR